MIGCLTGPQPSGNDRRDKVRRWAQKGPYMPNSSSHSTVEIDYAAVDQAIDALHAQAVALRENLDLLSGGWHRMLGATSGEAMTAFSFRAGDSYVEQAENIAKLEAAAAWLRRHSDSMKELDDSYAARLASRGSGGSQGSRPSAY